jgi:hypothetical protein
MDKTLLDRSELSGTQTSLLEWCCKYLIELLLLLQREEPIQWN